MRLNHWDVASAARHAQATYAARSGAVNREEGQMPLFAALTDAESAEVLTHVRQRFGGQPAVTPGQVEKLRKAP